jgi:hypothetical protein
MVCIFFYRPRDVLPQALPKLRAEARLMRDIVVWVHYTCLSTWARSWGWVQHTSLDLCSVLCLRSHFGIHSPTEPPVLPRLTPHCYVQDQDQFPCFWRNPSGSEAVLHSLNVGTKKVNILYSNLQNSCHSLSRNRPVAYYNFGQLTIQCISGYLSQRKLRYTEAMRACSMDW